MRSSLVRFTVVSCIVIVIAIVVVSDSLQQCLNVDAQLFELLPVVATADESDPPCTRIQVKGELEPRERRAHQPQTAPGLESLQRP